MKWICRAVIAVGMALAVLPGNAGEPQNKVEELEPFVVQIPDGTSNEAALDEFYRVCTEVLAASKADKNDKAVILMVEGNLTITRSTQAWTALNDLFNLEKKIAFLCNCPLQKLRDDGKTFWTVKEDDLLTTPQVVIDGNGSHPCLNKYGSKNKAGKGLGEITSG